MNLSIKPKEKLNKEKQKLHIKRHNYNNKGITLIALIITVVILLILAVVAINAVQGDGIIGYAKRSKEAYQEGQDKENIKIALGEYEMANYDGKEEKSLADFLKEKDWCVDATENDEDGSINVTTKDGKLFKITKEGNIEELTGIGLNKKQIILEMPKEGVSEGTSPSTTLTATLNGIEGEIKWSIEDNNVEGVEKTNAESSDGQVASINPETGNTITVTAQKLGKATITATCTPTGDDTTDAKLTATCEVIVTTQVEVSQAPFVEYNVTYTDMYKNDQQYTKDNGWRLQSATPNADGTYSDVKLMSTGIPAKLYYCYNGNNNDWFVKENKNKEDDGQVNNEENSRLEKFKNLLKGDSDYIFYTGSVEYYALEASAGLYYNFEKIKFKYGTDNDKVANKGYYTKISNNGNEYNATKNGNTETSTNGGEVTGGDLFNLYKDSDKATVRLLTLPELNKALNRSDDIDKTSAITDDSGLYQLNKLQNGTQNNGSKESSLSNYYSTGYYWLASPYPGTSYIYGVCYVGYNGYIGGSNIGDYGVRPLVCLNSKVQLIDTNGDGVLEIKGIE